MTANTKPIETIRDGRLKATIWKKAGDNGDFFTVRITRTWRDDDGQYHDSDSFSGADLLRVACLATTAYEQTVQLRNAEKVPS
jgi:hypothetical protein